MTNKHSKAPIEPGLSQQNQPKAMPLKATLVTPDLQYLPAYIEALRDGIHSGDHRPKNALEMQIIEADPLAFYVRLTAPLPAIITTPTKEQVPSVPTDTFWLIDQGLRHAREQHGLAQALVTCNDDNIGSVKVIEANGGREFRITPHPFVAGKLLRLYWVETASILMRRYE
jgi:hypothetical protein